MTWVLNTAPTTWPVFVDEDKVKLNGQEPGKDIVIDKGDKVRLTAPIKNKGDKGPCRVQVKAQVGNTWKVLWQKDYTLDKDETINIDEMISIDSSYIGVNVCLLGYGTHSKKWKLSKCAGAWSVKVIPPSKPVIDRESTKVDGKPPGTYEYDKHVLITLGAKIINQGGEGPCRLVIYDKLKKTALYTREKTLKNNQTALIVINYELTRNMQIEVLAYGYKKVAKQWYLADKYG